jgi:hypothetical protein
VKYSIKGEHMSTEVTVYKIKDLIRVNKKGVIDLDRSISTVHELAAAASFHENHNILIDSRDTVVIEARMDDLFELTLEIARFKSVFKNKIANVIPDDEERVNIAKKFKACMDLKYFQYEFFTDFESAIEWLSDTTKLNTSSISPLLERETR